MIKNIKLYNIKEYKHIVLDIETIFGNYIFFKNIDEKFFQINSRRYFLSINYNDKKETIGGISHNFYDDYKKFSIPELVPIHELIFSNYLNEIAIDMFINVREIIIKEMDYIKNFYDETTTRLYTLKNIYYEINKLEKELKHINLEEVII